MKLKVSVPSLLLSGITLATAWAARGQFGHEHGAAWAGAIGVLIVLILANRKDWWAHALPTTLAGALAWGVSGGISYGMIIGYGRSTDFLNVYYGFTMLLVIGLLYGFVGGGIVGVSLSVFKDKKTAPWPQLLVEMLVGGALFYFIIIRQLGYLMTPPRDELWASNFGMAAALGWFLIRNQLVGAMRVAIFSAIGAGFGFALGNFLQTMGAVSEVHFNWWNVMEYSIGFFGGCGMAYGIFTSKWEEKPAPAGTQYWKFAWAILLLVIPIVMWEQAAPYDKLLRRLGSIDFLYIKEYVWFVAYMPYPIFILHAWYWYKIFNKGGNFTRATLVRLLSTYMLIYISLSLMIKGCFVAFHNFEQYLYLINWGVLLYYLPKVESKFEIEETDWKGYWTSLVGIIIVIGILAFVASQSHPFDLPGSHLRFE